MQKFSEWKIQKLQQNLIFGLSQFPKKFPRFAAPEPVPQKSYQLCHNKLERASIFKPRAFKELSNGLKLNPLFIKFLSFWTLLTEST